MRGRSRGKASWGNVRGGTPLDDALRHIRAEFHGIPVRRPQSVGIMRVSNYLSHFCSGFLSVCVGHIS